MNLGDRLSFLTECCVDNQPDLFSKLRFDAFSKSNLDMLQKRFDIEIKE